MTDSSQVKTSSSTENNNVDKNTSEKKEPQQNIINSVDELKSEIKKQLLILFNKDNFLQSKYFIERCLNFKLEIQLEIVFKHNKFAALCESSQHLLKQQQHQFYEILTEEIKECQFINFDQIQKTVSPNFAKERNTIVIQNVDVSELEEFKQFIKQSEQFEIVKQQIKNKDKNEQENQEVENLTVELSYDNKNIVIIGLNEKIAQKCFLWLFKTSYKNQVLSNIQMTEYNYFIKAYKKTHPDTEFTGFVQKKNFQHQMLYNQQMMIPQPFYHQIYQQFNRGYQQQDQRRGMKGHFNNNNNYQRQQKPYYNNTYRNNNINNNGAQFQGENAPQRYSNYQKKFQNGRGGYRKGPNNYHDQRQQKSTGFHASDENQFPDLGAAFQQEEEAKQQQKFKQKQQEDAGKTKQVEEQQQQEEAVAAPAEQQ